MSTEADHVVLNTHQPGDADMVDTYFDLFENCIKPFSKYRVSRYQFYQHKQWSGEPINTYYLCLKDILGHSAGSQSNKRCDAVGSCYLSSPKPASKKDVMVVGENTSMASGNAQLIKVSDISVAIKVTLPKCVYLVVKEISNQSSQSSQSSGMARRMQGVSTTKATNIISQSCRSLVFSGTVHWFVGRLAFIHYCGLHQV